MFELNMALVEALVFLLVLVLVDVILGIMISLRDRKFDVGELPRFLRTQVLPYYVSIISLSFLAMVKDVQGFGTQAIAWTVIAAYAAKLVFRDIVGKIKELFGVTVQPKQ